MQFDEVMKILDGGSVEAELADQLRELIRVVMLTGRKGSLTLSITVLPLGTDKVSVLPTIQQKAPLPVRESSVFFADPNGNLSRSRRQADLRQLALKVDEGEDDA